MIYQTFDPSPDLQLFIKCFWSLEDEAQPNPARQRVVPDGCMEMIFNYGDQYNQYLESGEVILQPKAFIFGQITKYLEIAPTGVTGIIAARFLPEGLGQVLHMPLSELENKAVDIKILFGNAGASLEESVLRAGNTADRIKLIESFILDQLSAPAVVDTVTRNCVDAIIKSRGQVPVNELAEQMNIGKRKLERHFNSIVGMSPKQLSRVIRLQSAVKLLGQNNYDSLTSVAYESGYYDQAHFIKEFKEFTGVSPKAFFAGNLKLSSLFIAAD